MTVGSEKFCNAHAERLPGTCAVHAGHRPIGAELRPYSPNEGLDADVATANPETTQARLADSFIR